MNWLWVNMAGPRAAIVYMLRTSWDKALDVLGPKLLAFLAVVFIVPEVGEVVPSVADWLNLTFENWEASGDNLRAGTERLNVR